jgi:uncharacterized protein (TIGR02757 family)
MPRSPKPTLTVAMLDTLRGDAENAERLAVDPLGLVLAACPSADPRERELGAYVAAGLAMGNVVAIGRSVTRVLDCWRSGAALPFTVHRWVRGPDMQHLLDRLSELQVRYGSLEGAFLDGYVPGHGVAAGLSRLSSLVREGLPATRGIVSLSADPTDGSACKRLCLFLRWMVRRDGFDLGLWTRVSPADLIVPLDVHVIAFARRFELTRRATVNWVMADEVTSHFRKLAPGDPLRWDFAISHYGMMNGWS